MVTKYLAIEVVVLDELRSYTVPEERMEEPSVDGEIGVEITKTDEESVKVAAEAAGSDWKETKERTKIIGTKLVLTARKSRKVEV